MNSRTKIHLAFEYQGEFFGGEAYATSTNLIDIELTVAGGYHRLDPETPQ